MLSLTTEERLALLLSVLGDKASAAAFKSMNPTRAKYVEQLLNEYKLDPPSPDEVEYVVKDFNNYFSFAMEALGPQIKQATERIKISQAAGGQAGGPASSKPQITYFEPIEPSTDPVDPVADLNRLDPFQIGVALASDHPKTVALVLRKLEPGLAASVVETLAEESRADAVVFLSQESTVPERIVQQVLLSTFEKANSVTYRKDEVDQAKVLAELMRALPKEMRNELIERLTEENEELVESVRSQLYVFEDLLRLDDRDMQKVLGEIETDILIVALQKADNVLVKKLLGNLSKRARQTIEEEMQYKSGVSQEEIDEARTRLVETLGRLDEEGEVTLS